MKYNSKIRIGGQLYRPEKEKDDLEVRINQGE